MRIIVTGANGFIGTALVRHLSEGGHTVTGVTRHGSEVDGADGVIAVGDYCDVSDWESVVANHDVVIHLAARVHRMDNNSSDPLADFRKANVTVTERLARASAAVGVGKFIFLSSIKVSGERTEGQPFTVASIPCPCDPYGISKWEAEQELMQIAAQSTMNIASVRPPLVYGAAAKGNVARLQRLAGRGIPLPLASIKNARTMVSIQNLCSLLEYLLSHGTEPVETVLAGDTETLSTPSFYRSLGSPSGVRGRAFPFPVGLLRMMGTIVGRGSEVGRLTESLEVSYGSTDPSFAWVPPLTAEASLLALRQSDASTSASQP